MRWSEIDRVSIRRQSILLQLFFLNMENLSFNRVSIEGVKKLCIDFSSNQKLRYVKYHIYGQCKKLLKNLLKSEFIMVKIVKNQLKI